MFGSSNLLVASGMESISIVDNILGVSWQRNQAYRCDFSAQSGPPSLSKWGIHRNQRIQALEDFNSLRMSDRTLGQVSGQPYHQHSTVQQSLQSQLETQPSPRMRSVGFSEFRSSFWLRLAYRAYGRGMGEFRGGIACCCGSVWRTDANAKSVSAVDTMHIPSVLTWFRTALMIWFSRFDGWVVEFLVLTTGRGRVSRLLAVTIFMHALWYINLA